MWWAVRRFAPSGERSLVVLLFVALSLFLGLRREVGGDWDSYLLIFTGQGSGFWPGVSKGDLLYTLLNSLAYNAGAGIWLVNLACGSLLSAGIILFCSRQPSPAMALTLAIPVLIVIVGLAFTRQSAAIGLLLLAHELLLRDRRLKALAALLCAVGFHWSAAAFLPLAFCKWRDWQLSARLCALMGVAAAAAAVALYHLNPGLVLEVAGTNAAAGVFLRAGFTAVALVIALTLASPSELRGRADWDVVSYCSVLAAFALCLAPVMSTIADRTNHYLIPYQMVLLPFAAERISQKASRHAAELALAAISAALFLLWLMRSEYAATCWFPYRTFLDGRVSLIGGPTELYRSSNACNALQQKPPPPPRSPEAPLE
jgi:hypothetical protein